MEAIVPIFIVITVVVSWLVNLGKQNEQKQRREDRLRQRRERSGGKGQAKANDFMEEGNRRQQAVGRGQSNDDDVEIVEQPRTRRPPKQTRNREEVWREQTSRARQRPQQQPAKPSRQPARPAPAQQQRTQQPAPRPVEKPSAPIRPQASTSNLSARQVESAARNASLSQLTGQHLKSGVSDQVTRDMGVFSAFAETSTGSVAQSETTRRRQSPAAGLREVLRNPQTVRQALILNEVLARPVALRK